MLFTICRWGHGLVAQPCIKEVVPGILCAFVAIMDDAIREADCDAYCPRILFLDDKGPQEGQLLEEMPIGSLLTTLCFVWAGHLVLKDLLLDFLCWPHIHVHNEHCVCCLDFCLVFGLYCLSAVGVCCTWGKGYWHMNSRSYKRRGTTVALQALVYSSTLGFTWV